MPTMIGSTATRWLCCQGIGFDAHVVRKPSENATTMPTTVMVPFLEEDFHAFVAVRLPVCHARSPPAGRELERKANLSEKVAARAEGGTPCGAPSPKALKPAITSSQSVQRCS